MSDSLKNRLSKRPNPRLVNLLLLVLVIMAFLFCLLLYRGVVSSKKSLEVLAEGQLVSPELVAELNKKHERERAMDLVLIVISGSMGVILIVFYRYVVRISTTLGEIQTIDHDILNSITRGILTVDLQGVITSYNLALEEILGVEGTKLIGRPLEKVFRPEDSLYQLLKESIQEEARPRDEDLAYTSKTGSIMPLRVTTFTLKNEVGKRVGGILLVKDLTEIRKMAERIQRTSRLAALGELTQRLVHEIRNPLSAMDINLQLLQERLEESGGNPEIGRYIGIISTETRRLNEVLRNAQLFSKPEPPDLETVDLHQIISQILLFIKEEASRKDIELVENLQAEESLIQADEDQMKQVFINLFKNSLEAMDKGGKLEVLSRNDGGGKIIGVELVDTGSGIPMAKLERVFDPYFTSKKKGSGLGLSIVHNIITQHGGSIDVSSWLGEGTIFSISLPLASGVEDGNRNTQAKNSHS